MVGRKPDRVTIYTCSFCGAGPYKNSTMLSLHMLNKHGPR